MRTGELASPSADRPFMSWYRHRSPSTIHAGLPLAVAAPIADETSPSIPFAPRLHRKRTRAGPAATNASWSRIGMLDAVYTSSPSAYRDPKAA